MNHEIKVTGRILPVSEATRKRNPELWSKALEHSDPIKYCSHQMLADHCCICKGFAESGSANIKRRLRQSDKPLLNKLEQDWLDYLHRERPWLTIVSQSVRLRLANGAWYKCDHFSFNAAVHQSDSLPGISVRAWECKGPRVVKGCAKGILAIKVAAAQYPQIAFYLVSRVNGQWSEERVLP